MVDRYSGYPFVHRLSSPTSLAVTNAAKGWFNYFGLPSIIRSDGGPQFKGEAFRRFCFDNDIKHEVSSPYNPESNGLAEAAVKNCKKLLVKCIKEGSNFQQALAEFRNCPRADGCSPSLLMLGRGPRGALPALQEARDSPNSSAAATAMQRQASYAEVAAGKRRPTPFSPGQTVWVQDSASGKWDAKAVVLSQQGSSYTIEFEDKKTSRRNEKFLRPVLEEKTQKKMKRENEGGQESAESSADPRSNSSPSHAVSAHSAAAAADPVSAAPLPPSQGERENHTISNECLNSDLPTQSPPAPRRSERIRKRSEGPTDSPPQPNSKKVRFNSRVQVRFVTS